jgi:Ser/Thr protein kinase RdoA (MazF antagonist)
MTAAERERAIRELADMLDALHATDTTGIADDIEGPHAVTRADVLATVDRAAHEPGNDPVLIFEVGAFIRDRWDRVFDTPHDALVHGDPHLENVLWDGTRVTALVDLEWSRRAWRECDLEILIAHASHPALFAAADYEATIEAAAYRAIPEWLRRAKPAWFEHPHLPERIALMFASRTLGCLVDAPGNEVRHAHLRQIVGR